MIYRLMMVGKYFYISVINKNVRFGGCGLYRFVGRCGLKIKLCTICTIGHSSVIPPKAKIKQKIFTPKYFLTSISYWGIFQSNCHLKNYPQAVDSQSVISRVWSSILRLLEVAKNSFFQKDRRNRKNDNNIILLNLNLNLNA